GASVGRLYSLGDEGRPVAVVSYGFWRRRLGGDAHVAGRALRGDGGLDPGTGGLPRDHRTITGAARSPASYPLSPPASAQCQAFGRLRDGITRGQTREALAAAAQRIGGEDFARRVSGLSPMAGLAAQEGAAGDDRRFFVFFVMLFGIAVLLALIACLNVGGL